MSYLGARRVRRLADRAVEAWDAGDATGAHTLGCAALDELGARPSRGARNEGAWAAWAAAMALLARRDEIPWNDVDEGAVLIDCGLDLARSLNAVGRLMIEPRLLVLKISVEAVKEDYHAQSISIAQLWASWEELSRNRDVQGALAIMGPERRGIIIRTLIDAADACLLSLRLYDASLFSQRAVALADAHDDLETGVSARIASMPIARLLHEPAVAGQLVAEVLQTGGLARLPATMSAEGRALSATRVVETQAWLSGLAGDHAAAAEQYRTLGLTLELLRPINPLRVALARSHEVVSLVEAGMADRARSLIRATNLWGALPTGAGGCALQAILALAEHDGDLREAVAAARALLEEWEDLPLWDGSLTRITAYLALAAASQGDGEMVVRVVRRSASALTLASSGRHATQERQWLQRELRVVRDRLLSSLASTPGKEASTLALQVLGAWRDQTVRDLMVASRHLLTPEITALLADLDATLAAVSLMEEPNEKALDTLVAGLQTRLADLLGRDYALLAPSHPLLLREVGTPPQDEVWIAAALVHQPPQLVTVYYPPSSTPTLHRVDLDDTSWAVLTVLMDGFEPGSRQDVVSFEEAWNAVKHRLAYGLGLSEARPDVDGCRPTAVRFFLDPDLENVPVGDLPLDGDGTRVADRFEVRWSTFVPTREKRQLRDLPCRPAVLAYHYELAKPEADLLAELDAQGLVTVTTAATLQELRELLINETYDVLVMSCHGEGAGLSYQFANSAGDDVLQLHELIGVAVPPRVVLASCSSGRAGTDDITGVLSTMLGHGADEVLCSGWDIPEQTTTAVLAAVFRRIPQQRLTACLHEAKLEVRASWPSHLWESGPYWWDGLRVISRS